MGPATFLVTLVTGMLLILGALLLGVNRSRRRLSDAAPPAGQRDCPRCGQGNPATAAYCGNCGERLSAPTDGSTPQP
jgi:membrane protease subunit (stomatin/prohibitin family)